MAHSFAIKTLVSLAALSSVQAYFLVGVRNILTTERIDPIMNAGGVASHVHTVMGGSNFRLSTNTSYLRQSECTSMPIKQDKSNYWFPTMYFQWKNGSFSSVNGGAVMYYLFDDKSGVTTAFPDDFRMISGDPTLRTYDANSKAQQAVTFLCLDFNGVTTRYNELPAQDCPSGVRSQINFPMCWDGKNSDSSDHKSHVAFPSEGADKGTCSDPKFPKTLPRVFSEIYWDTASWSAHRKDALNSSQPFVFSNGDPTGYGYHGDFINGWDSGVLQKVVDNCHCNPYGDATCCAQQGLFDLDTSGTCRLTKSVDETTTGTLLKLPGNNPVQGAGHKATQFTDSTHPGFISPVYVYTGDQPSQVGTVISGGGGSSPSTTSVKGGHFQTLGGGQATAVSSSDNAVPTGTNGTDSSSSSGNSGYDDSAAAAGGNQLDTSGSSQDSGYGGVAASGSGSTGAEASSSSSSTCHRKKERKRSIRHRHHDSKRFNDFL